MAAKNSNRRKVYCPVCQVNFISKEHLTLGDEVICTVCGAKLEITNTDQEVLESKRYPMDPEKEIRERVDTFAKLRRYTFNEDKEDLIEGLLEKYRTYGDFYCPCRFDNIPEHVCPCLETRQNAVKKEGQCL